MRHLYSSKYRVLLTLATLVLFLVGVYSLRTAGIGDFEQSSSAEAAVEAPQIDPDDTDGDGLKDSYERIFFHTLDESGDADGDGLPDALELRYYGDLTSSADEDRDGLPDKWELTHFGNLDQGPDDDPDGDGLTNIEELQRGRGFRPDRRTTVKSWDESKATATVSGSSSVAGSGKRGPDGKVYFRKTYERLLAEGKFDTPWNELK